MTQDLGDGTLGAAPDRVGHDGRWSGGRGRVLLCSSNGGGLGHLTRLMAVARRLPPEVDAIFVTMSQGLPLVTREGYTAEYVPTAATLDADAGAWQHYLRQRMDTLVAHYRPDVLVYDGVSLYRGLVDSWRAHDRCVRVWLRRAMWRPGAGVPAGHEVFDLVLEPGDIATANDLGVTAGDHLGAGGGDGPAAGAGDGRVAAVGSGRLRRVDPIIHLDERELLPRAAARQALGLDPERPAALLSLGAGNINNIAALVARIAGSLGAGGDVQAVAVRSPIAAAPDRAGGVDGVLVRSVYPVSRYLRAFDLAFAAAGYNSFHELIAFAVPTVFVPNEHAIVDDQGARARYAEWAGAGLAVSEWSTAELTASVAALLDPHVQARLTYNCRRVFPGNGAAAAAELLATLAVARREPVTAGSRG